MPEPIRIGIIGAGHISQEHRKAYRQIEGALAVVIADLNEEALLILGI